MPLTPVTISPLHPSYKQVKSLYTSAFPPEERVPLWLLVVNSWRSSVSFLAYYDGDAFVGFSYVISDKHVSFVFFLAVNPEFQSKGYGSQMLNQIKAEAGALPLLLAIEPLDTSAPNYNQRIRRLAFYQKQGFYLTDSLYHEGKESYQVMLTAEQVDVSCLEGLMKRFFLGSVSVKLTSNDSNTSEPKNDRN